MSNSKQRVDLALNVISPRNLAAFYADHLGMEIHQNDEIVRLGYSESGSGQMIAGLELRPSASKENYVHNRLDEYWKIGITIPNIDIAYDQLSRAGIEVTEPHQFQDIGYMCHLSDPEGFQIELLQHTFEGRSRTMPGNPDLPLGGGAQIGQITLRVTDIETALTHYRMNLGMRLLSKQVVEGRGFTLYFLAFTDEAPPNSDIEAVENRPWLWQRPYTTLELQHLLDTTQSIRTSVDGKPGYAELLVDDANG